MNEKAIKLTKNGRKTTFKLGSNLIWFGGKDKLAKKIKALMPDHKTYVDVFGGGANVLLQKERQKTDIYNDINGDAVNYFLTLRADPNKFYEAVESLPYSRKIYETWKKEPLPDDDFERAVRWFYINRGGRVGGHRGMPGGWRQGKTHNTVGSYRSACELIDPIAARLKNVMIECKDFRVIIKKYDSRDTLFYVDPPYVGREKNYAGGFKQQDHIDLARLLNQIQGKAIVSYYQDERIDQLYSGWKRIEIPSKLYSKAVKPGESRPDTVELLLLNF